MVMLVISGLVDMVDMVDILDMVERGKMVDIGIINL